MLNSVHAALGNKALESSKPPDSAEQMIQSLQDRLYAVLKEWDHPTNPGPGLHTSLCYLFVSKGMYKRSDTCPKLSQKMIYRLICIVYKNSLPMSDEVFGLEESGGASAKRKRRPTSKT